MLVFVTAVVGGMLSILGAGNALLVQLAAHPAAVVLQSERNSNNKEPPVETIVPGLVVPEKSPIRGDEVVGPS